MTSTEIATFSHVGVGVTDADRSSRFYCEAFGFTPAASVEGGSEVAALVGFSGDVRFKSRFLVKGSMLIELVEFEKPATVTDGEIRPMNLAGLTHLSFRVTRGIEDMLDKVRHLGGTVLEETRIVTELEDGTKGICIFCRDPDGTRVEVMEFPAEVRFDIPAEKASAGV